MTTAHTYWNDLFANWAPQTAAIASQLAHLLSCPTCQLRFIDARTRTGTVRRGDDFEGLLFGSVYAYAPFDALVMVMFAAAKTTVLTDAAASRAIAAGANAITQTTIDEQARCAPPEPAGPC